MRRTRKFYCFKCRSWIDHAIFGDVAVCLSCGDEYPIWVKLRHQQMVRGEKRDFK